MYNSELKERYIKEKEANTTIPEKYLARQFAKTEETEQQLKKDVSCFTTYEIIDFYKSLNLSSFESLVVLNNHLALYTDWCLKQNIVPDYQNHYAELDRNKLINCINKVALHKNIINLEKLYTWMRELVNPSDAFILIALFEGIKGENFCEIVNIKLDDFNGNTVSLCTGRTLTVSKELINIAEKAYYADTYYSITGNFFRKCKFADEDLIVKNYPNCYNDGEFQKGRRIYKKLMRIFDFFGENTLKANSLTDSGKIHFIKSRSAELNMSTNDFMYSEYVKEINERFDCDFVIQRSAFIKKYKEYLI